MLFAGFDIHREFSQVTVMDHQGRLTRSFKVPHDRGALLNLSRFVPPGTEVAVEACPGWSWIADELEAWA
jgi:hypothetical protein